MNTLPVPYLSQIMPGALQHNNDCGAASTLMVLNAYNLATDQTVDQIYTKIAPSGDGPLSATGMQALMSKYKLKTKWMADMQVHDLFDILADQRLTIALIHYAPLVAAKLTEKTNFLGAHFVVVVGLDFQSICINDPYSTGKGEHLEVPLDVFKQAWSQCNLDGNPIDAAIVTTVRVQDLSIPVAPTQENMYGFAVYQGRQINGINVRSGPASSNVLVTTLWRANTPFISITQISGDWGLLTDGSGWVYMPYLTKVQG